METINKSTGRIISIDSFRGLTILLMVLANFLAEVHCVPSWMKHAEPPGWTIVDLIAPAFFFAIALTMPLSFKRRMEKEGKANAYFHTAKRACTILGIGIVVSALKNLFLGESDALSFGVLGIIGFALLINVPFIRLPWWMKLLVATGLAAVHQLFVLPKHAEAIMECHHQILGMPGPGSLVLFGLVLSDLWFSMERKTAYVVTAVAYLGTGLGMTQWIPPHRFLYSASFILISTGIAGLGFSLIHIIKEKVWMKSGVLSQWGHNPLLLFLLHYILILFFMFPSVGWWHTEVSPWSPWLIALECILYMAGLQAVVYFLEKKTIIIKV